MEAVDVRIEVADAVTRPSRLLVLKHAQSPLGVDAQVVDRMELLPVQLPVPGSHLLIKSNGLVAAASVLFLGVPRLAQLDYKWIRDFGRRALSVAAKVAPDAPEVCITLHGPGFGLDESESFESEVAGLVDAVSAHEVSPGLRVVTFLEIDRRRAAWMDSTLEALLPGRRIDRGKPLSSGAIGAREAQRLRSVGYDSDEKSHAFVAMPFAEAFDDVFHYGIQPSIHDAGYLCVRIDQVAFTGDIVDTLRRRISSAKFLVADVTGANPNVYLEIGFAWGCDVPTVLVCRDTADLMFDIRGQRCVSYSSIRDLEAKLGREISALFL